MRKIYVAEKENATRTEMNRTIIIGLVFAILVFPLLVVHVIPTDDPQPYVFKFRISKKLDETLNGQLQYFLVERLEGNAPDTEFVVLIDSSYTRGLSEVTLNKSQEYWGQGSLMTPEVYYGEQYLFFGRPQIYVRQLKGGIFWPDQITELKLLYQAPITRLIVPAYVVLYPFMEEFTLRSYFTVIAQTVVIVATLVLMIKNRNEKANLVAILLAYALLTMIVTIPVLTDLY